MKKYKVVNKGLDNYSVGDVIELTDEQAKNRANKVELVEEKPKKQVKKVAK